MTLGTETEKMEFKKTTAELTGALNSITAILNKHNKGELYFGVLNNGTPEGQPVSDKTLRDISQAVNSRIEPKIFPSIEKVVIDGSLERKKVPEVPVEAIREALINSFCHKDYNACEANEVAIFRDRIEIYNPGTFPKDRKTEDYIEREERPVRRNPLIANILYYSKDIESSGTGLRRIYDACKANGTKAEFRTEKSGFTVVFFRCDLHAMDKTYDQKNTLEAVGGKSALEVPNNCPITARKTYMAVAQNPQATIEELHTVLGIAERTVKTHIAVLKKEGLIRRAGSKKKGYWEIIK
jgi:ATP-dependent DNA helicase RecG